MIKTLDSDFNKISSLNWYPWLGKEYDQTKLLLVGESHYEDGDFWQLGNKETTRIITQKRFDDQNGKWTLHKNVEKIILDKPEITLDERKNLWNSIGYWNLVQRLLDSRNQSDRPTDEDFDNGWKTFFKLIEILEPNYCLVLGKASYGRLGYYLNNSQNEWQKEDSSQFPNEKIFKLTKGNKKMTLIFINHPSGSFGFNYKKWADLFKNEFNIPKI